MVTLISTPQELHDIRNDLSGNYELVNDIDLSDFKWNPIGESTTPFKGTFDGKGYKILNLTITTANNRIGLFGFTDGASIRNVAVENVNIESTNSLIGGLVGYFTNSTMDNCYTTGDLKGSYMVGGLIGGTSNSTISNCYSTATITGSVRSSSTAYIIGGLVGNESSKSIFKNCYSTGLVTNYNDTGGGFIGRTNTNSGHEATFTDCYWDIDKSGRTDSAGGKGLTTSQFADPSHFTNWDTDIWGFSDYPFLKIFTNVAKKKIVDVISVMGNLVSDIYFSRVKEINTLSHMDNIANEVNKKLTIEPISFISTITGKVDYSNRQVRSRVIDIISKMNPISSKINRNTVKVKNLTSYLKPIHSDTSVITPFRDIPIYAHSYAITSQSEAIKIENMSNSQVIKNPSYVEVI
ncbi:GLUG motif-containing protein [Bacillus sp. Hm123]|uniref:GLUG motif-containing protein n=1 Tax=Bacillus sp. Hm123 TaxID=3450745 RepID=UPI003F43D6B0